LTDTGLTSTLLSDIFQSASNFMKDTQPARVRFGVFELDLNSGELRAGEDKAVLREQPLQVLRMLVEREGELATREEIKKKLWPNDTIVEFDHSINAAIRNVRRALGDSADEPKYIETLARRGYRLMVPVEWVEQLPVVSGQLSEPASAAGLRTAPQPSVLAGRTVSHYRVLDVIGGGGMGVVYRAEDLKLGRQVALKFLPEELGSDAQALERFSREARAASSLDHPNICPIHEFGEHEGRPFMVMQLLEGQTLSDRLAADGRALPPTEVLDIGIQVSDGLQAAHEKGIIHRDIKPANIYLTSKGVVKILDFGLAKLLEGADEDEGRAQAEAPTAADSTPSASLRLTRTGATIGTAGYMSPEQVRGEKLDARTDIFSLGLVLYEMATGQRAFTGETAVIVEDAIMNRPPAPAREINPELSPELEEFINKALEKGREQRYRTAAELGSDLERLKNRLRLDKRRGLLWLGPALVLLLLVIIAGYFWRSRSRINAARVNTASIAVLPFADMSPNKDQEYFSDGLAEELTNELAKVPGLKVAGRSSAFQFKGKNEDLRRVGQKLNVANILEGSVRREGSRVRITAELTKADDGFQLWSEEYNTEMKDIFVVQDEIARAVTGALQAKLLGASAAPIAARSRSTNPDAYQAFLQAQYFLHRGGEKGDFDKALAYADQAIKLDANYPPAWALRSAILSLAAETDFIDKNEGFRRAREDAERAITLDPNLAAGYLSLAGVHLNYDLDWEGAKASVDKAAALEPRSTDLLGYRSELQEMLGHLDEAIELRKQAIAIDPLQALSYVHLGTLLYEAGRYEEANAALQKARELDPQNVFVHYLLGQVLLAQGRPQEAIVEMQRETADSYKLPLAALAYYSLGRRQASGVALRELIGTHANDGAFQIAEVYAYRGEADKALEWLDRAYQQHDSGLTDLKADPLLKSLRQNPRYIELLKKMRLPL
jgi:serine/threonine protein kinase/predicted Zn-dependent protease